MRLSHNKRAINYEIIGSGKPIIWIHGFGEDRTMWPEFIADQFPGYKHYLIDLPGAGESPVWENASIDDMAGLIIQLIEVLNLEKPIVIGHSMGGYVALAMGEMLQNQLGGLVLFHSHPYRDDPDKKQQRTKSAEFIRKHGTEVFVKELIPKLFPPEFAAANPELLAQLIEGAKHYPAEGLATAMEAMRDRPDQTELISNFPFPVGIIVGLQDTLIPGNPIDLNQMKLRGGGVIKMTRSIGHMGMYEAPEETRSHLKEFLAFGEVSKD